MNFLMHVAFRLAKIYFRIFRPLTIGVKGLVIDQEGRVLLVRHSYQSGWHLPGGGVKKGESSAKGLVRELREEVRLCCSCEDLELLGVFYNRYCGKHDHVILYRVQDWQIDPALPGSIEIVEAAFFSCAELPADVHSSVRARLSECREKQKNIENW